MLYFENDYSEGAHPKLLQRLMDTNMEHLSGYGFDTYTLSAKEKIRELCGQWYLGKQEQHLIKFYAK